MISHLAKDVQPEKVEQGVTRLNILSAAPVTARTREEITAFFDGLRLVEPGVAQVDRWRGPDLDARTASATPFHCGVAEKITGP